MLLPSDTPQRRRISITEAETENTPKDQDPERVRKYRELTKPFGFKNTQWEELKVQMQPGDELWEFCTDRESWEQLMGSAGIELVRGGHVVASIVTRMN
jgi:hypothetical protein